MIVVFYILILIGTFLVMEGITLLTHRYIMHGFLWYLHQDHHQPGNHFFEKNDAFFFIFAIPSFLCKVQRQKNSADRPVAENGERPHMVLLGGNARIV